jgi:hypothetical protein
MITIDRAFVDKRPLSYSKLKEFRKSPKHYVHAFEVPFIQTDPMLIGSAADCILIDGEEAFGQQYTIYEGFAKRSNDAKAEWQAMVNKARTEKKTLISKELAATAWECVKAVRAYPDAQPYLNNMRRRHPKLLWTDRETGLPCIGYPDWDCMIDNQLFIVDLKCPTSADPEDFTKDAWKWEYFIQVGSYLEGYKNMYFQFPNFVFICVETAELHNVSINYVEGKYMEFSRDEYLGTVRAFKYCLDNNLWDMGYEFRLMATMSYFALLKPGYGKRLFGNQRIE